jgi:4-alpha-glucanotransferase
MKILQFAFSTDAENAFLPHNFPVNCVAYTGTHDNDTTIGWYQTATEKEKDFSRRYLARSGEDIAWDMIRAVWNSTARYALAPLQDFLRLGSEARMNLPGSMADYWTWRFETWQLTQDLIYRMKDLNELYGRVKLPPRAARKPVYDFTRKS